MSSNLPTAKAPDSAIEVKEFFNQYLTEKLSFPAAEVDAVIGFFENRGFEKSSAIAVATALLEQSKIDDVNVFVLIDTLGPIFATKKDVGIARAKVSFKRAL